MSDGLWRLRAGGEAFLEEVSAEYHAAHAGLKAGAVAGADLLYALPAAALVG